MSMIELEISEDERANLHLVSSLGLGLSDSTLTLKDSTKSLSLTKASKGFKGPPIPVHRDGMGRYVPRHGERPLTERDHPTPGPNLYLPDYTATMKKFPEYSMGDMSARTRHKEKRPGPNKYNTVGNMAWGRCKTVTIKYKHPASHKTLGPGPGKYCTTRPSTGPAHTIRTRLHNALMPGLVSKLTMIPNQETPGPSLKPCDEEWLQKPQTFGTAWRKKRRGKGPGPASYAPSVPRSGPEWKIGTAAYDRDERSGPGPADYLKCSKFKPSPGGYIGRKYTDPEDKLITPGPGQYAQRPLVLDEPGYSMQYRWYERDVERTPGPADYKAQRISHKTAPAFSIAKGWGKGAKSDTPGPANYKVALPNWDKGRSIARRQVTDVRHKQAPGPGAYDCSVPANKKSAPAFSMTPRRDAFEDLENPGPNYYRVGPLNDIHQGRSIGNKIKHSDKHYGPGPAARTVNPGPVGSVTSRCKRDQGATVKSRHTPNKYLGLPLTARLAEPVRGVPPAPLLG